MSSQGPLPFFRWNDIEVANAARVVEYLRNGLGQTPHWELSSDRICGVLYRDSLCAPVTYTSPAVDPAPWYNSIEPGSSTFLGVVPLSLTGYDSVKTRTVTPRLSGFGGGVWTQQRRNPRTWKIQAALISADDAGAEYGLRWLTGVLGTTACDECTTGTLEVRLVCPPDDCSNDDLGRWICYDAALTTGPYETQQWSPGYDSMQGILAGCRTFTIVEFEIDSGNPYLYKPSAAGLASTVVTPPSTTCQELQAYFGGFYYGSVPCGGNLFIAETSSNAWVAAVQSFNPVLWYRMDATGGVTEDDLGTGNHDGTYQNFPTLNQPGATSGSPAVTFHKSANQYLLGADDNAYSIVTTGALTVAWWAKAEVQPAVGVAEEMVAKWNATGNNREYIGERFDTGESVWRVFPPGGAQISNNTFGFPSLGEFHFFVATMKNNAGTVTVKTYLDTTLVDTQTFAFASIGNTTAAFSVGARAVGAFPLNGTIDEVFITSTELSQADINTLYATTQPPICLSVDPPTTVGQILSPIFTFESGLGIGSVQMAAYSDCPRSGLEEPELLLELRTIPANSTVVVDCAQRTVTLTATDPATGAETISDGQSLLLPTGGATLDPIQWIDIADCDDIHCICVSVTDPCVYTGDTFVTIDTQVREG